MHYAFGVTDKHTKHQFIHLLTATRND